MTTETAWIGLRSLAEAPEGQKVLIVDNKDDYAASIVLFDGAMAIMTFNGDPEELPVKTLNSGRSVVIWPREYPAACMDLAKRIAGLHAIPNSPLTAAETLVTFVSDATKSPIDFNEAGRAEAVAFAKPRMVPVTLTADEASAAFYTPKTEAEADADLVRGYGTNWRGLGDARAAEAEKRVREAVQDESRAWEQPAPAYNPEPEWPEPLDLFRETPLPKLRGEYLPDAIKGVITEQAFAVGADPAITTIAALVACAACIHDGIKLQPRRNDKRWTESARLWGAVVGEPSVRKSPAAGRFTSHLWAIDRQLHAKSASAMAAWMRDMKDHKKSKSDDEPPPKPANYRLMVQDATMEKVSDLLADNDRGMVAVHRELAAWFGQMDCYRQGGGSKDQGYWLSFYDGGPMVIDRMSRESVYVPNGSMCLIGEIQPSKMRKLAKDMPDDGLLQRFMVVMAKRFNGIPPDVPVVGDALADFYALQDDLFAIQPSTDRVLLADDVLDMRVKFEEDMLELADSNILPDRMKSAVAKWVGLWCRLALTYHVIDCCQAGVHPVNRHVSIETATAVDLFLRRFLMGHAFAFYSDLLGGGVGTDHAKWIAGYLLAGKVEQIDNRAITHAYKAWRTTPDWARNLTWRSLEDSGWLLPVFSSSNRFKVTHWQVNPKVHEAFADIAESEEKRRARVRERLAAGLGKDAAQDNKRQQMGSE